MQSVKRYVPAALLAASMLGAGAAQPAGAGSNCQWTTEGATWTLQADCATTGSIVVPEGIDTVDGGGHAIAGVARHSALWKGILRIEHGPTTVRNIAITLPPGNLCDDDDAAGIAFEDQVGAVRNVTIDGGKGGLKAGCGYGIVVDRDLNKPVAPFAVEDSRLVGIGDTAIFVQAPNLNLTIENNEVIEGGDTSIWTSSFGRIADNRIVVGSFGVVAEVGFAAEELGAGDVVLDSNAIVGGSATNKRAWGVYAYGGDARITNNTVQGFAGAIFLEDGAGEITGNTVTTKGSGVGISSYDRLHVQVADNTVVGPGKKRSGQAGVYFLDEAEGTVARNTINRFLGKRSCGIGIATGGDVIVESNNAFPAPGNKRDVCGLVTPGAKSARADAGSAPAVRPERERDDERRERQAPDGQRSRAESRRGGR